MYPFEEWERIEQKLAGLSNFNPTKKKFLNRTNYYGQQVEMDGQGRLLMPQLLRESAADQGRGSGSGQFDVSRSQEPGAVQEERSKKKSSRLTMRRRSTNWASSGRGINRHPSGGWAWWWKAASHVPVLLKEAIDFLAVRRGGTYIDATVGLGGHSYEIAKRLGAPGHLIGLDKDPAALEMAGVRLRLAFGASAGSESSRLAEDHAAAALVRRSRKAVRLRQLATDCWPTSASAACSWTTRRADLVFRRMDRSTCGWTRVASAPPNKW